MSWKKNQMLQEIAATPSGREPSAEEIAAFAEQLRGEREREQQGRDVNRRRRREERQRAGYE